MRSVMALVFLTLLAAAAPPIRFVPQNPHFAAAAGEYRAIWEADGPRIVAAMEAGTGLRFPAAPVEAIVNDSPPMTAYGGRSMRLRAAYSPDYKKATLVHELGHLLSFALPRTAGLDDHRLLYLFLYDVWTDLYGRAFADRMVAIERRIPGGYDYDAAWTWALAMSREERQARLAALSGGRCGLKGLFAQADRKQGVRQNAPLGHEENLEFERRCGIWRSEHSRARELKAVQLVCRP